MLILILWEDFSNRKYKILKAVPGPLVAVAVGIILSNFLYLEANHLVQIPVATSFGEFLGQFSFPDFSQITNPDIYVIALVMALVASIETLLCVEATDKLDPQKYITPTNRELKAQGIGNIVSGLIGGLPITQVVVRSTANIEFGAKSKASTIFHGFLLLISAIAIPSLLNMVPLATLACVLLVVGYKLAKPQIFKKIFAEGYEQFIPFLATIAGMLIFDLLKGVGIGMIMAIGFIIYHNFRNACSHIKESEGANHRHKITLSEEVSFLNKGKILQILNEIPGGSKAVIDGSKSTSIHPDIIEIITNFQVGAKAKNISLEIRGINLNQN
jgi:SulP family sulfate permease